jgi:hypothetical protein
MRFKRRSIEYLQFTALDISNIKYEYLPDEYKQ